MFTFSRTTNAGAIGTIRTRATRYPDQLRSRFIKRGCRTWNNGMIGVGTFKDVESWDRLFLSGGVCEGYKRTYLVEDQTSSEGLDDLYRKMVRIIQMTGL